MRDLIDNVWDVWLSGVEIWNDGGWAMWALAAIALAMFGMGVHIHLRLRRKAIHAVPEEAWRQWIEVPQGRHGTVGRLLDFVTGGSTLQQTTDSFEQLRMTETAPFERDLKVMKVCVSAAPLVGLLGTVTGMLSTFDALASGSGGEKTMAMIASGISEALITTETGLVLALPGLFFQYQLARRFDRYKTFLAHLQTVCTQKIYKRIRARRELEEAKRREFAKSLQNAVLAARGT